MCASITKGFAALNWKMAQRIELWHCHHTFMGVSCVYTRDTLWHRASWSGLTYEQAICLRTQYIYLRQSRGGKGYALWASVNHSQKHISLIGLYGLYGFMQFVVIRHPFLQSHVSECGEFWGVGSLDIYFFCVTNKHLTGCVLKCYIVCHLRSLRVIFKVLRSTALACHEFVWSRPSHQQMYRKAIIVHPSITRRKETKNTLSTWIWEKQSWRGDVAILSPRTYSSYPLSIFRAHVYTVMKLRMFVIMWSDTSIRIHTAKHICMLTFCQRTEAI